MTNQKPESRLTMADVAVLTLLAEGINYGYEINATIEERHMRDWTALGFSSIYNVLKKLEKLGLVTSELDVGQGGPPAKRRYKLSTEGERVYFLELEQTLLSPSPVYRDEIIGMVNLEYFPKKKAISLLEAYFEKSKRELEETKIRLDYVRSLGSFPPFTVQHAIRRKISHLENDLKWQKEFLKAVRSRSPWRQRKIIGRKKGDER